MDRFERIATLDDEVQAEALDALLSGQNIPHVMACYHDTALDGIFQGSRGWGHVEAPAAFKAQILAILADLKNTPSPSPPDE
ncbi:MAG TPA: hypothetical protein PKM73_19010 [Verrucomicrobiota bacterium]|nr:hypothetical protein [Verrucomicrobiota bacterium]